MTTAERYFNFLETQYVAEDDLPQPQQPEVGSNMTTGPDRTPLRPWTKEQVDAYRKQRLKDASDADSAK